MNISFGNAVVKTYNQLSRLPLGSITAEGWIKDQLLRSKEGMGGHLDELEPDMIATPFITYSSFKHLPNDPDDADPTFAAGWSGEISGTYWTGLIQLAFTLNDQHLIKKAITWVNAVLKHQEPDGYLGSYSPATNRLADYNPWSANWCYRALLSFYEATGRQDVLLAVYRGLLWFCENWKNHKTDYAGPTLIESMIMVYALTGDKRLLTFCEDWIDWLEDNTRWQNSGSRLLSSELPYTSMHVVAYGENVKHPAVVYCANGNEKLLHASVNGMEKALRHIVQTTGGASSCNEYLSPKGAVNETEYCNFATFNHSYHWLTMATGEARWGDEIERALFNGAEGARKKDERAIAYVTAPNQVLATRSSGLFAVYPEMAAYAPCYNVACCPTQSVRILPEFVRTMALIDQSKSLHLFCYGPATIMSPKIDLTMDTLYPFRDTITLTITRAKAATLHFRIPAWCKNPAISVNGEIAAITTASNGFACIDQPLFTGDIIVLHFPMEITINKVDDSDSASKFPISIERGPLVYALPIPTKWTKYPGNPITPLPKDWCWYEAWPEKSHIEAGDMVLEYDKLPWAKAVDETITPDQIRVIEHDTDGYVWENPPITLEVPLYHAEHTYLRCAPRTYESWGGTAKVSGPPELCTLVPHGCTNLRITYLPRAAK
ncbi:MAG: hypothetical protein E7487_11440 [Ruminococcaceae bacterium]|nr:hypothetical protein [Oscillospiraceae bacterium]